MFVFFLTAFTQGKIDVLHYKFEIELGDNNDTIYGKAEITLEKYKSNPNIKFDLSDLNSNGKGMILDSVKWDKLVIPVLDKNVVLSDGNQCRFENNALMLYLSSGIVRNTTERLKDTISIKIYYHGIPSDGLIISKNKYGKRTFFADNWPDRAHHWLPCIDDPADKASVEFIVTAPQHYSIVSNGLLIAEKSIPGNKQLSHWKEDVPLPTKVMVIGVADFAVEKSGEVNNIPVYSWVYANDKEKGFYDYAQAVEVLSFLTDYIGPFPYKKLANVQSKTMFGGMENASAIFYSERSVTGNRTLEGLLVHEIAHQWFGDMATEKSFAHLWLSEGFATYMTHIYMESKYGTDSLEKRMENDRKTIIDFANKNDLPVVDTISSLMSLLNANGYQKGSWILHMLRRMTDDSVFHQIIRTYYETYKGKNADSKDFQVIAEKISGKSLESFFRQWLYQPGVPRVHIKWSYDPSTKNISFTISQLQKTGNFEFPLEILIQEDKSSMPKRYIKIIKENTSSFTFPSKSRPIRVEVDPLTSLLFEGFLEEIKN